MKPDGTLLLTRSEVKDGEFHIKAAGLELGCSYFAAKVNGNFFRNRERYDLPNIQSVIVLCDAQHGYPLALLDSIEISILRTGAASSWISSHERRESRGREE